MSFSVCSVNSGLRLLSWFDSNVPALGRLVAETRIGPHPRTVTYQHDLVGNRVRRIADGVVTDYVYDVNDRLVAETGVAYTYDANGNRLTRTAGGVTLAARWDALDRLVELTGPGGTTTYAYDLDGRMVRRHGRDRASGAGLGGDVSDVHCGRPQAQHVLLVGDQVARLLLGVEPGLE